MQGATCLSADPARGCLPLPEPDGAPAAATHRKITAKQRHRLEDAVLSGIRRILASSRALHGAAAGRSRPDSDGLLAVAAGLYTYAFEEYGKLLLVERLPEKGGVVSVPYREIFRSHGKKFEAARGALPKECWSAVEGYIGSSYIGSARVGMVTALDATFRARMSMLYIDMDSNGDPAEAILVSPQLLENALTGMDRAVEEWEARNKLAGQGGGTGVA